MSPLPPISTSVTRTPELLESSVLMRTLAFAPMVVATATVSTSTSSAPTALSPMPAVPVERERSLAVMSMVTLPFTPSSSTPPPAPVAVRKTSPVPAPIVPIVIAEMVEVSRTSPPAVTMLLTSTALVSVMTTSPAPPAVALRVVAEVRSPAAVAPTPPAFAVNVTMLPSMTARFEAMAAARVMLPLVVVTETLPPEEVMFAPMEMLSRAVSVAPPGALIPPEPSTPSVMPPMLSLSPKAAAMVTVWPAADSTCTPPPLSSTLSPARKVTLLPVDSTFTLLFTVRLSPAPGAAFSVAVMRIAPGAVTFAPIVTGLCAVIVTPFPAPAAVTAPLVVTAPVFATLMLPEFVVSPVMFSAPVFVMTMPPVEAPGAVPTTAERLESCVSSLTPVVAARPKLPGPTSMPCDALRTSVPATMSMPTSFVSKMPPVPLLSLSAVRVTVWPGALMTPMTMSPGAERLSAAPLMMVPCKSSEPAPSRSPKPAVSVTVPKALTVVPALRWMSSPARSVMLPAVDWIVAPPESVKSSAQTGASLISPAVKTMSPGAVTFAPTLIGLAAVKVIVPLAVETAPVVLIAPEFVSERLPLAVAVRPVMASAPAFASEMPPVAVVPLRFESAVSIVPAAPMPPAAVRLAVVAVRSAVPSAPFSSIAAAELSVAVPVVVTFPRVIFPEVVVVRLMAPPVPAVASSTSSAPAVALSVMAPFVVVTDAALRPPEASLMLIPVPAPVVLAVTAPVKLLPSARVIAPVPAVSVTAPPVAACVMVPVCEMPAPLSASVPLPTLLVAMLSARVLASATLFAPLLERVTAPVRLLPRPRAIAFAPALNEDTPVAVIGCVWEIAPLAVSESVVALEPDAPPMSIALSSTSVTAPPTKRTLPKVVVPVTLSMVIGLAPALNVARPATARPLLSVIAPPAVTVSVPLTAEGLVPPRSMPLVSITVTLFPVPTRKLAKLLPALSKVMSFAAPAVNEAFPATLSAPLSVKAPTPVTVSVPETVEAPKFNPPVLSLRSTLRPLVMTMLLNCSVPTLCVMSFPAPTS